MMRAVIFLLFFIINPVLIVNAAEMNLESKTVSGGELSDGDVIATGRVFCENGKASRVSLLNIQAGDKIYGNIYTLQGRNRATNKLIVRLEGDGWHSSGDVMDGIYKKMTNNNDQFYVVVNGRQNVNSDTYTIKTSSTCSHSHQE
ncbi:TPA: AfaD family invasin [Escherichia coli]